MGGREGRVEEGGFEEGGEKVRAKARDEKGLG